MSKSVISVVAILATVCFFSVSGEYVIKSMDDFLAFNKLVIEERISEKVVLETDLDFSSTSFPLPVGVDDAGKCHIFTEDFYGNGHIISNLKMDGTKTKYGSAALFCGIHYSSFNNLTIDKSCEFTGEVAAAVAATATYNDLHNVNVYATINGKSVASAFIGKIEGSLPGKIPVGHITDCQGNARINVNHNEGNAYVGGYIGFINSTYCGIFALKITFEDNMGGFTYTCKGSGTVSIGALIGSIEKSEGIEFEMNRNTFNIYTNSDKKLAMSVGGLVGRMLDVPMYKLTMKDNTIIEAQGSN